MNVDLNNYVEQARKSGMSDEQIRQGLLQSGWGANDINEALMGAPAGIAPGGAKPKAMMSKHLAVSFIIITIAVAGYFAGAFYTATYQDFPLWPFEVPVPVPTFTPRPAVRPNPGNNREIYYNNNIFGFAVGLPSSWDGYTVNRIKDDIYDATGKTKTNNGVVGSFEIVELHHPLETAENPREDVPVYIFTSTQWENIQKGEWSVGAAPIPPSLLGQNSQWIMALPARYNYDYKTGWEEVDQIVHTLQPFEPSESPKTFCTQEAKLCPDGTAVGRTGPNCEFAPCP